MAQITPEQTTKAIHPVLGIMGGLGPAASCYLYQMITDHTPAQKDQDHIDIVISSRASTPDRTAFIVGKSKDDPFDVMEQDGISLVRYGATVLAIACNTAHYFYDRLAAALPVPVLNMPRLTAADAKSWVFWQRTAPCWRKRIRSPAGISAWNGPPPANRPKRASCPSSMMRSSRASA